MATSETKHYWLYALRLEQGKYYIGTTTQKDPNNRIKQHVTGFNAAKWTQKYQPIASAHKPIELGDITELEAHRLETHRTLQYMKKYGYNNVRGGDYSYSGDYIWLFRPFPRWRVVVAIQLFVILVALVMLISLVVFRLVVSR